MDPNELVEMLVQTTQVRKREPEWTVGEEGRVRILKRGGGDDDFPTTGRAVPADLTTFERPQFGLGPRSIAGLAYEELAEVFLSKTEVQSEP